MNRSVTVRLILPFLLLSPAMLLADKAAANIALNQGRADDAIRTLQAQLSAAPHDAVAHQLLCRTYYSIELDDQAIEECELAVADAPSSSESYLWLGRAYGLKASHANPVSAFRLARKVAAAFEEAVKLDPASLPALSDLGEFYVAAPSLVGGGLDKAQELANRMMPPSATKAHRLLALIAEKKGDLSAAEAEFRRAVEAQPSAGAFVDLAAFYQRQKRTDQCVTAIQAAVRLDRVKDAALVDAATILTDAKRSPQLAQQLLVAYLGSPAKSDEEPAAKVHVLLGNLLLNSGDQTGARREYQAALALASVYLPAQKALKSLPAGPAP